MCRRMRGGGGDVGAGGGGDGVGGGGGDRGGVGRVEEARTVAAHAAVEVVACRCERQAEGRADAPHVEFEPRKNWRAVASMSTAVATVGGTQRSHCPPLSVAIAANVAAITIINAVCGLGKVGDSIS